MSSIHFELIETLCRRGLKITVSFVHLPDDNTMDGIAFEYYKKPAHDFNLELIGFIHTWSKLKPYTADQIADQIFARMNMEEALE